MAEANFADKTIWTGDNLDILRGLDCGLLRNDGRGGGGWRGQPQGLPLRRLGTAPLWPPRCGGGTWIPAFAGMTGEAAGMTGFHFLDCGLRRNDGRGEGRIGGESGCSLMC